MSLAILVIECYFYFSSMYTRDERVARDLVKKPDPNPNRFFNSVSGRVRVRIDYLFGSRVIFAKKN